MASSQQRNNATNLHHHEIATPDFVTAHAEHGALVWEETTEPLPAAGSGHYEDSNFAGVDLAEFDPFISPEYQTNPHAPSLLPVYPAGSDFMDQVLNAFPKAPSASQAANESTICEATPKVQMTNLSESHASSKPPQRGVRSIKRRADPEKDKKAQGRCRDKKTEAHHMLSDEYAKLSVAYRTYVERRLPEQYQKKEPDVSKHWRTGYGFADADARASLVVK